MLDVFKIVSAFCQNTGHQYWIWNAIALIIAEQVLVPRSLHASRKQLASLERVNSDETIMLEIGKMIKDIASLILA